MSEEKKTEKPEETYGPQKEVNYFEKKLEISKDNLAYAKSQLGSIDTQIKFFIQRHEYDLEIFNQRISHLQQIEKNMKERIISLQKKIDAGFVAIDMKTGKAYKSRDEMHKDHLAIMAKESKDNYEKSKTAYVIKKKKGQIPKPVVEPPTGETIESQPERELRLLKEKSARNKAAMEELKERLKAEKKAKKEEISIHNLKKEDLKQALNVLGPIDETEINKDKVKCPECQKYYTKGGAFTAHYKAHYPNGKV